MWILEVSGNFKIFFRLRNVKDYFDATLEDSHASASPLHVFLLEMIPHAA